MGIGGRDLGGKVVNETGIDDGRYILMERETR
jgi:hypothetical protein